MSRSGPTTDELVDALAQASFATMATLNRVAADHDLSLTQLRMLGILRDRRLRMSELADHLGLDRSTISGLVDRASSRGLIERAPHPGDGRATDVFLSADGHRLAAQCAERAAELLSPLTDRLTAPEARRLAELIGRVVSPPAPRPPTGRG